MLQRTLLEIELQQTVEQFAKVLKQRSLRIVFAESCTAGLLSATLSKIPGISNFLCGSFVTYRNNSKSSWLGVSVGDLDAPEIGPVSETVAIQMAVGALQKTPEAEIAISVTGHLGPNAPPNWDGIAFSAVATRTSEAPSVVKLQLLSEPEEELTLRQTRQIDAAIQVLQNALKQPLLSN